ncbi:unnamed protein product [Mytilus edulis]|uniref:Apple domain-containing protein n=1 Tax=Mytilus edulis TaxID=6550 RepID=A0A8S3UP19_MYTED|nr:unnamed protein product [Mytilus edulis]
MKGSDEFLIQAEEVKNIKQCENQCNDDAACRAFRYLPRNSFCLLYKLQQYIEDDIGESQFYVKRCILCYMNATKMPKDAKMKFKQFGKHLISRNIKMLLEKALWILAFTVVSLTSEVYGILIDHILTRFRLAMELTKKMSHATARVWQQLVQAQLLEPLAIAAAGFGTAGIVVDMIVVPAGGWFVYLQAAGVLGVGTTGKMILGSTVAPLCAAICGSSEERQGIFLR